MVRLCQRDALHTDMIAVILGEPLRQIALRHVHAGRVVIADIEDDQRTAVVILRNVIDRGCAGEAVHDAEADAVLVEHRREHAAHGALLAHHQHALRLLQPEVATIGPAHGVNERRRVGPAGAYFELARFVDDPFPRNVALLARHLEQAIHALHLRLLHGRDQAGGEQLVTDAPVSDRLRGLGRRVHRLDQIERPLRHTADLS